jgi:hypothetical protein
MSLGLDSPKSRTMSLEHLHGSPSTVAVTSSLLAAVHIAFMCALGVIFFVSRRCCSSSGSTCLGDIDWDKVARSPVQQRQLDCYWYSGLRTCRIIRHVCIPWQFDRTEVSPAGHCVFWVHPTTTCVFLWQHCWEVCHPMWRWCVSRKKILSGRIFFYPKQGITTWKAFALVLLCILKLVCCM